MLRDGESGLGVEDDDEPETPGEKGFILTGLRNCGLNPAGGLTVESSRSSDAVQSILETQKQQLSGSLYHDTGRRKEEDQLGITSGLFAVIC